MAQGFKIADAFVDVDVDTAKVGAGIAAIGPLAHAAVAGAIAGVPLLFAGIGIAALKENEKVKASFTGVKDHVSKELTSMAAPLIPVLVAVAALARSTFDQIAPHIAKAFVLVGPIITKLATSVSQFVIGIMPGLIAALGASQPVIDALSAGIANMGPALSQFFTIISGQAPAAAAFMTQLFNVINWLLPVIAQVLAKMMEWQGVLIWVGAGLIGLVALVKTVTAGIAAYNAIMTVVRAVTVAWTGVQWLLNAALTANPIGIVVVAIAALVAALVLAWRNSETFRSIVLAVWNAVKSGITSAVNVIKGVLNWFGSLPGLMRGWWNGAVSAVTGAASSILARVRAIPGQILGALGGLGSLLVGSGRALLEGLWRGVSGAIGWVKSQISGALSSIRNLFPFSPAKEGPFSGSGYTTHSGRALAKDFAGGIMSAVPSIRGAADAAMAAASQGLTGNLGNSPLTSPSGISSVAPGVNQHVTVNVQQVSGSPAETGRFVALALRTVG